MTNDDFRARIAPVAPPIPLEGGYLTPRSQDAPAACPTVPGWGERSAPTLRCFGQRPAGARGVVT